MKRVIVAGSRGLGNEYWVHSTLDRLYGEQCVEIVSGGACGADRFGESWVNKTPTAMVRHFLPDYDKYKNGAPLMRNTAMAEYGDALVLFWDGRSRGSKDMLTKAYKAGIQEIHIYRYKK